MFPNEIILTFFVKLDIKSLIILSSTCKKYYNLCNYYIYELKIKDHLKLIFEGYEKDKSHIIFKNIYTKYILPPHIIDIRKSEILIKKIYNKKNYLILYFNLRNYINLSFTIDDIKYKIKYISINGEDIKIQDFNELILFFDKYFNKSNNKELFNNSLFILEKDKFQKDDLEIFFNDW